jgi:hypothetical protein
MAGADIFRLKETGLGPFLSAEIGVEENGSALTMLSVLARLGHDPWGQAAVWARLSHAAATRQLADIIWQMPLPPQVLAEAPHIAARLSRLLPRQASALPSMAPERATACLVIAGLCIGLSFAFFLAATRMPDHSAAAEHSIGAIAR